MFYSLLKKEETKGRRKGKRKGEKDKGQQEWGDKGRERERKKRNVGGVPDSSYSLVTSLL